MLRNLYLLLFPSFCFVYFIQEDLNKFLNDHQKLLSFLGHYISLGKLINYHYFNTVGHVLAKLSE